ncbi:MAG TPA: GNAT family N-acetyltransferase [Firmicutes bacterium]|nr:GNAT family N-acetyltransferase [Bacillota bacterium]
MCEKYVFRKIEQGEVPQMFQMILERMKWMDEKGIKQWNVTKYDEVYPFDYYEKSRLNGEVFVLQSTITNQIVAAAILKNQDERWQDNEQSIYLHNFVTRVGEKGVGSVFLAFVEEYARTKGKTFFRLDSAEDNPSLSKYYDSQGFLPVGKCTDGLYRGILREKKLV